jgi:hypothetical protein
LEYFRTFYGFEGEIRGLLGWGFGLTAFYLMIEAFLFKAVLYRARKNGALIKLSE